MTLRSRHLRAVCAVAALLLSLSCERPASKSDYVSARVSEMCQGDSRDELQTCRIAVIKQFKDVPLEELRRRYPEPEPRPRPSCAPI